MDVDWFLKERTGFIRYFYDNAAAAFLELKRKMEDEEEPFVPPYSEDGEPAFQIEYQQAVDGIEAVGVAALSMLSDTLKVFFLTWERELGIKFPNDWKKRFRKEGFVPVYRDAFGQIMQDDWSSCPVDFAVIEQVVLARNDAQHGKHLALMQVSHSPRTVEKHSPPFFISEVDKVMAGIDGLSDFASARLSITREDLFVAIDEVEKLADWMELRLQAVRWPGGEEAQKLASMRAESEVQ